MLGFAEPRSFHRSFKQWMGQTPGQFRETQLNGVRHD
jgi:AraC-like DNA-binding protein